MGRRWETHVVSGVRVFGAQPTHSCFEESFFGSLLKCVWVTAAPQVMWSTDSVRVFTVDGGWVWTFAAVGPLKRRVRGLAGVQVCVVDSRTAPAVGTVTTDTPLSVSPRSAVPAGTTSAPARGATGATVPSRRPAGRRGSGGPERRRQRGRPAAAGLTVGLPRAGAANSNTAASTPGSTGRPTTASASPVELTAYQRNVRSPWPGGQAPTFGVTGLAARPSRPRAATVSAPPSPAAVAAVPWQTRRPPLSCRGKRGQQVRRWLERRGRRTVCPRSPTRHRLPAPEPGRRMPEWPSGFELFY